MNTLPSPVTLVPNSSYETTRFNALRHGVLSRHTVLPWEDRSEYQTCSALWWQSMRRMDRPKNTSSRNWLGSSGGSAGCGWQRRPCIGRSSVTTRPAIRPQSTWSAQPCCRSQVAPRERPIFRRALVATPADTARDLRDVKRDQTMTRNAWNILAAGGPDAYARALAALQEDTRAYWQECLAERPADGMAYAPTVDALRAWIDRHWKEWYEDPIAELENRDAIRDQALGAAYAAHNLLATPFAAGPVTTNTFRQPADAVTFSTTHASRSASCRSHDQKIQSPARCKRRET